MMTMSLSLALAAEGSAHLSTTASLAPASLLPNDPRGGEEILDPAHLVAALGDSPRGQLRPLCALFVGEMYARLKSLRAAVAHDDEAQVAFLAHALRGSAANFGALRLMELGDPALQPHGAKWITALEREIAWVDRALSELLAD